MAFRTTGAVASVDSDWTVRAAVPGVRRVTISIYYNRIDMERMS